MFQLSFCVFSQFTQRSVETWLLFLLTLLGFYAVKFQTRDTRNAAGSKSTNICSSCEQRPFQIYCFPNINPHHCNITPNNRNHLLGLSLIMMMSSNRKSTTLLSSRVAPGHRITFDVISIGLGRSWFKLISSTCRQISASAKMNVIFSSLPDQWHKTQLSLPLCRQGIQVCLVWTVFMFS